MWERGLQPIVACACILSLLKLMRKKNWEIVKMFVIYTYDRINIYNRQKHTQLTDCKQDAAGGIIK